MAVPEIFKVNRKTFFNPSAWLDLKGIVQRTKMLWFILKTFFSPQQSEIVETFDEAVVRMGVSEAELQQMIHRYRLIAYLYVGCACLMLFYAFYLLFRYKTLAGWLLALGATAIFVSQGFKYDFWAFQMRERKLGLTFNDWTRSMFG